MARSVGRRAREKGEKVGEIWRWSVGRCLSRNVKMSVGRCVGRSDG